MFVFVVFFFPVLEEISFRFCALVSEFDVTAAAAGAVTSS